MLVCVFFLIFFQAARAQNKTVTGTVTDDKGGPLAGATVKARGNNSAAVTDANGRFSLAVPSGVTSVVVSYVGFEEQSISLSGGDLRVSLHATKSNLDEVVVVGYGTQ